MIPTVTHKPSGETIAVFTSTKGHPLPVVISRITKVWVAGIPDYGYSMTLELGSAGYCIMESARDVYRLLRTHGHTCAYYESSDDDGSWPESFEKDYQSLVLLLS